MHSSSYDISHLISLLDKGKTAEAIEIASRLVRELPGHVTGHVVLARALESQGEFRNALASWRAAMDLLPNSPLIEKGLRRTAEKLARSGHGASSNPAASDRHADDELSDDLTIDVDPAAGAASGGVQAGSAIRDVAARGFRGSDARAAPRHADDASGRTSLEVTDRRHSDDLTGEAGPDPATRDALPGFDSTDSMFDVEPDFERILSHDLTADVAADSREDDHETSGGAMSAAASAAASHEQPTDRDDAGDSSEGSPRPAVASDELDGLISELSNARITPQDRQFPQPDLDTPIEDVATETLAKIYEQQNQYTEAARVFSKLAEQRPDRRDHFLGRAAELRRRAGES